MKLAFPLIEFSYKDDALGDPFIIEDHAVLFGWATREELARIKEISLAVNKELTAYFAPKGVTLVDFKLEFGVFHDSPGHHRRSHRHRLPLDHALIAPAAKQPVEKRRLAA